MDDAGSSVAEPVELSRRIVEVQSNCQVGPGLAGGATYFSDFELDAVGNFDPNAVIAVAVRRTDRPPLGFEHARNISTRLSSVDIDFDGSEQCRMVEQILEKTSRDLSPSGVRSKADYLPRLVRMAFLIPIKA